MIVPIGTRIATLAYAVRLHREGVKRCHDSQDHGQRFYHGTDYRLGFSTRGSVEASTSSMPCEPQREATSASPLSNSSGAKVARLRLSLRTWRTWTAHSFPKRRSTFSVSPRCSWKTARGTRSSYAIVTVSEGARMIGRNLIDGEPHLSIGSFPDTELRRLTGVETINQQLAYLMRAGTPDALDRMVAVTSWDGFASA